MQGTPADSDTGADMPGLDMRVVVLRGGLVPVLPREAGSPVVVSVEAASAEADSPAAVDFTVVAAGADAGK